MDQTAGPSIFKSSLPSSNTGGKGVWGWIKTHIVKIILVLLVIAVVVELVFGGMSLFSPSGSKNFNPLAPNVSGLKDASLSLVTDKASYKAGDQVVIKVKLFTGGYSTDSTDLIVKYDPSFLEPLREGFAVAGNIYPEYPAIQLDSAQGMIGMSGITPPGTQSFNGAGDFATLYFKALKDGQTKVTVDFQEGATADSNVVLTSSTDDILGLTENADVLITGDTSQAPELMDKSCDSFTQACLDSAGNSGTQICKGGSTKNGSCGYDSRFTESCSPCQ